MVNLRERKRKGKEKISTSHEFNEETIRLSASYASSWAVFFAIDRG